MTTPDVDPAVAALSKSLLPESDQLALGMAERIREEVRLYRDAEIVSDEELVESCQDNLRYVLGSLAGYPVRSDPPRRTGVARAERGFPTPLSSRRTGSVAASSGSCSSRVPGRASATSC
jgi:hypothetical protein